MGIDVAKVSIAPCGVDLEFFTPVGPAATRERRHRILSVGRLVPRKGVDTVIQALALLRDKGFPDTELLIVGARETPDPTPILKPGGWRCWQRNSASAST